MRVLLVLFIALFAVPVFAQDADPLPACELDDREQIINVLREVDFANAYTEITDAMQDMEIAKGDLLDIIEDLDDLQVAWWTEITTEFPDCLEAQNLTQLGGRMLDELLAVSLFGQLTFALTIDGESRDAGHMQDRFAVHLEAYTDRRALFMDALTAMLESVQE